MCCYDDQRRTRPTLRWYELGWKTKKRKVPFKKPSQAVPCPAGTWTSVFPTLPRVTRVDATVVSVVFSRGNKAAQCFESATHSCWHYQQRIMDVVKGCIYLRIGQGLKRVINSFTHPFIPIWSETHHKDVRKSRNSNSQEVLAESVLL